MVVSSRTPEGEPHYCRICGDVVVVDPSEPLGDSTCPQCGILLLKFQDAFKTTDSLHPEDKLAKLADSLDVVELVMELEEEFDISIPDDEAERIQTVGDAIRFIRKLRKDGEDS